MSSCSSNIVNYEHKSYDESKDSTLLEPVSEGIKGNRSIEKLGKANPAILYRKELNLEKQIITQEFIWPNTPKGPNMEKMRKVKK